SEDEMVQLSRAEFAVEAGPDRPQITHGEQGGAEPHEDEAAADKNVEQISSDMMTLSLLPKAKWQTLLHLDLIKERNKPAEPPKAPEKVPFFLPSPSAKPADTVETDAPVDVAEGRSRITRFDWSRLEDGAEAMLRAAAEKGSCEALPSVGCLEP